MMMMVSTIYIITFKLTKLVLNNFIVAVNAHTSLFTLIMYEYFHKVAYV